MVGLARGNTIRARHIGKDVLAVFRNLAGGEIHEYTKMLAEAREQAQLRRALGEAVHAPVDELAGGPAIGARAVEGIADAMVAAY